MKWAKTKKEIEQIRKKLYELNFAELTEGKKQNDGKITEGLVEKAFKKADEEINSFYSTLDEPPASDYPAIDYLHQNGFSEWLVVEEVPVHYEETRSKYEALVGGFLYFFENHVSTISKDDRTLYFDWGKINKAAQLTIFLNPLYNKPVITKAHNSKLLNTKGEIGMEKNAIAAPPGGAGDPPPPPPPPPPPRS